MHCLAGSLLWQEIFGNHVFWKNMFESKKWHFFCKQSCLSAVPKRIRSLIKPSLKNSFSTNFQGTGPWEGPVHFSRFVLRVHNCSKNVQSWSWSQEKKEKPFTKATFSFSFFLFLFLSLSVPLPLPLILPLPLPPPPPLPLPLPPTLPLSLSLSLSLSLFLSLSLITCFIKKKLKVEKVTQSTCWTPLTASTTSTANTTSSSAKKKYSNCSRLKSLLKCRFVFPLGDRFFASNFKEGIGIVEGRGGLTLIRTNHYIYIV